MANTNHKLYLGMYSFKIKKNGTKDTDTVSINDFLSEAYPDVDNKFQEGFAQEIIDLFDSKTFKNKQDTHGGTLEEKSIATENRYFDIVIDGGLTGIQQFLLDEDGNKEVISKDKVVGLKFYARFWMPAGNKTGYIFIQKYGGLSLKPLFDELVLSTLRAHGFNIADRRRKMTPITTKKRLKEFLKKSSLRDVTVISKQSSHDTGMADAQTVTVRLSRFNQLKKGKAIDRDAVEDALKNHGFTLGDRYYDMTATYESRQDGKKVEEKTTRLDATEDTVNIIPNILIPEHCIDQDRYPRFEQIKQFVNEEIEQIKTETKM